VGVDWSNDIDHHLFDSAAKMIDPSDEPSNKAGSLDKAGAIVKMVRDWDELRNTVRYHPSATWREMIDLLSKPIDTVKRASDSSRQEQYLLE
jgi:hypothetical protein